MKISNFKFPILRSQRGEIAIILTLLSVALILAGMVAGNMSVQKRTRTQLKAADNQCPAGNWECDKTDGSVQCAGSSEQLQWTSISAGIKEWADAVYSVGKVACVKYYVSNPSSGSAAIDINAINACKNDCTSKGNSACPLPMYDDQVDIYGTCNNNNFVSFIDLACANGVGGQESYGRTDMFICCKDGCKGSNPPPSITKNPPIIVGDCTDANAWVCQWPDQSWKNCLGVGLDKQGLFNNTYCDGEKMWRYQAAKAHGGTGSECGGITQNLKSVGCGTNVPPVNQNGINAFCLGEGGDSKVATSYCLQWGQSSPFGGGGKSTGLPYCCDACDPSQANAWTNTCFRPNSQNSNYQGPCKSDAGVAFPMRCVQDPTDNNKWKWVSQNHYGECNTVCAVGASGPTATPTPRVGGPLPTNTPVPPVVPTNTPVPVPPGQQPTNTPVPLPTNTPVPISSPTPTILAINSPTPIPTSAADVYIYQSSFQPGVLRIKQNITVKWINYEATVHTVTASSSTAGILFDSGSIPYNNTFMFTFSTPGTYYYYSKMNLLMTGIIIVEDPNAPPTPTLKPGEPTHTPIPTFIPPSVTIIPSPTPKVISQCYQIEVNGSGNGYENIVILGDKYDKADTLIEDARKVVANMKDTNLGAERLGRLNYYVNTTMTDYGVNTNLDYNTVQALIDRQKCNGSTLLLLTRRFSSNDTGGLLGVSHIFFLLGDVRGSKEAVVLTQALHVARHELAHAIAGIHDEYDFKRDTQDSDLQKNTPPYNCSMQDDSQPNSRCKEWKNKYGDTTPCMSICGFRNWYRSSADNIMNNNKTGYNEFDKPSLDLWSKALGL